MSGDDILVDPYGMDPPKEVGQSGMLNTGSTVLSRCRLQEQLP
jgi:hypothetical protein